VVDPALAIGDGALGFWKAIRQICEVRPWDLDQYDSQYWPSQERPPMPKRRPRSFTPQFKAQVVLEVLAGLKSQAEVARQHKLKPELLSRWKDIALEGLESLFQGDDQKSSDQDRIAELERMVGRLTMELEVAKKLGWQRFLDQGILKFLEICGRIAAEPPALRPHLLTASQAGPQLTPSVRVGRR
jgi:transposase-like protein